MLLRNDMPRWISWSRGRDPFSAHEAEGGDEGGEGDRGASGGGAVGPSAEDLAKENAALKAKLSSVDERLSQFDKIENERKAREEEKAEKERLKKEGAEKLLEEKDAKLKDSIAKLEAFEKRERERADKIYDSLGDSAKKVLEPLRDKLQLADWVATVERHAELSEETTKKGDQMFIKPKPGNNGKQTMSPVAAEIMEDLGRDAVYYDKLKIEKDADTREVKFTRPVREFFADMPRIEKRKLVAQK